MNADTHPHNERQHAQWSASATSRNVVCAGAIAMSTLSEDRESEAAAWGTCCHEISERCLRDGNDALIFIGEKMKQGKFDFVVDEEMCSTSQAYVDYCQKRLNEYPEAEGAEHWIEAPLSLSSLNPPLEAGGTGDFVIYFPRWRLLEVVDLKGGRGVVVDVKGNPQGRSYAIGALLTLKDIVVDRVMVTIVQPRVGDGLPKSETFHISELLDWTVDLLASMQKSKNALDEFTALGGNRVAFDDWAAKWLTTGQCTFCSAQAICPKRRQEALAAMPKNATRWFEEPDAPMPDLTNMPRLASPEELARWLDGFEAIEDWIKAVRGHAHAQAERGVTIPDWGLVDKIGNRAFIEKDEAKLLAAIVDKLKITKEQALEPATVKSVAQIEKALGSRKAELAKLENDLWHKPVKGTNLVRLDKTTRPPAAGRAERFHEEL